jgi:L-threonylcarbamoyladenylate synthase
LKTPIIKINPREVEAQKIQIIAGALSRGEVIAYPTDTYYGLGASCFLKKAIRKIYRVKHRQMSKALPVLIADVKMVREIAADIPPSFRPLTAEFWPGPLTLVLKGAALLPSELVGPEQTIGIRLPAVPWLRELIRRAGFPVIATSANISGGGEIASVEKVVEVFEHKVDLIVDGGQIPGALPSTVIDLTSGAPILVREGAIPKSRLRKYLT